MLAARVSWIEAVVAQFGDFRNGALAPWQLISGS
jgi:hypothetical protein